MLKFGNKEFRNLQEQVLENMKDIANLQEGTAVLSEFGIKVVGEVESIDDLPTVLEYKSEHEDWAYGDAYAVGTTSPYTLYILTRANDTHEDDYWFDIGVFPAPGPQGEQGPRGEQGPQGQTGATGDPGNSAGFGTISATAETLSPGSSATATVVASGPDTAKEFSFTFGIPQGQSASFVHYVTISASTIVGGQYTGTLTLTQYNTLYDNYDSIVVLNSTSSLANNKYFLKRWYVSDDYLVYIGVWSLNNNDTRYYLLKIDRSNRNWTLDVGQPIKITSYNINSTTATAGQVLTADGNGGASWQDNGTGGVETVTLTTTVGNLSDADYTKVSGNNCVIIYDDNTTKVTFRKYDESSTTITYAIPLSEGSSTYNYGVAITKATKYYQVASAYMPISVSSIKSGSTIADKYLKTNGSGGAVWGDAPSQVQSDWNESSQSSPAYIKNKPTIPTVPVTDVTVNGTSVLDGTVAKVLVDTVDGTLGGVSGTDWTTITINGSLGTIPAAQVQANWNESDTSDPSYIQNKPNLNNFVTLDSVQNITAKKTFKDKLCLDDSDYTHTNGLVSLQASVDDTDPQDIISSFDTNIDAQFTNINGHWFTIDGQSIKVTRHSTIDTPATYGVIFPETSGYSADKTLATTDEIPTVNNGILTIQQNGTVVNTFSANTSYNATANIIVPTDTSDLNNDSGFITSSDIPVQDVKVNGSSVVSSGDAILGTAALCDSTANVTSGSSELVTSGGVYTAIDNINIPTSASSSSTSTSTVTPTTSSFVTGITPTTDTWTFALSDGTSVTKTVVLGITPTTDNAMTGATVATTTTTTTTLS